MTSWLKWMGRWLGENLCLLLWLSARRTEELDCRYCFTTASSCRVHKYVVLSVYEKYGNFIIIWFTYLDQNSVSYHVRSLKKCKRSIIGWAQIHWALFSWTYFFCQLFFSCWIYELFSIYKTVSFYLLRSLDWSLDSRPFKLPTFGLGFWKGILRKDIPNIHSIFNWRGRGQAKRIPSYFFWFLTKLPLLLTNNQTFFVCITIK